MVDASRYAITTQDRSVTPRNVLAMAGSALARIVWSAAARNIATITPGNTTRNACSTLRAACAAFDAVIWREAESSGMGSVGRALTRPVWTQDRGMLQKDTGGGPKIQPRCANAQT